MFKPILVSGLAVSLVAGCASTPTTIDSQKVAAVDRAAHASGVQVIWVSYPQRRVAVVAPAAPTGG